MITQESPPHIVWAYIDSFKGNSSAPELTYHRPCPICASLKSKVIFELTNFQFYSDSASLPKCVNIRETICLDCFTLYLNPCYSDYGFDILFAEAGQSYGSTSGRPKEQIEWMIKRRVLTANTSVLDIGCYEGAFLSNLPSNIKKLGIDIDKSAIERGRSLYQDHNIHFFLGNFDNFQYTEDPPDTITMFHVLEHLPNPIKLLKKLHAISHPKTKLILEVPILENGATNDINGFFSVQHMTHFSRTSLRNCLSLAGWKIEDQDEQKDYNGCRILASVADPDTKNILLQSNQEDWGALQHYFSVWYNNVLSVEKKIQALPETENIIIWGGGAHTEFLYHMTTLFHARHKCKFTIVDSDPLKHGKSWRGIPIHSPCILSNIDWSSKTLLISSYGKEKEIAKEARKFKAPQEHIHTLYNYIQRY